MISWVSIFLIEGADLMLVTLMFVKYQDTCIDLDYDFIIPYRTLLNTRTETYSGRSIAGQGVLLSILFGLLTVFGCTWFWFAILRSWFWSMELCSIMLNWVVCNLVVDLLSQNSLIVASYLILRSTSMILMYNISQTARIFAFALDYSTTFFFLLLKNIQYPEMLWWMRPGSGDKRSGTWLYARRVSGNWVLGIWMDSSLWF